MRILIIGGEGTIGRRVAAHFMQEHEVVVAGRSSDHYKVDIASSDSIMNLLDRLGSFDSIICTAGEAKWAPFAELSEDDYYIGIQSKLMGQVNLVRIGRSYLQKGGSITLTTGILADDPVPQTASAAMVNGGIHSFIKAAALEMTDGMRINVVSSGVVEDAYAKYKDYFPGHPPIPMDRMTLGYVRSVLGKGNGEIIKIYE